MGRLTRAERVALGLAGLAGALLLTRCGGDHVNAPAAPPPEASSCPPIEEVMPNLFALLDDPSQPLGGLKQVIGSLATNQPNPTDPNSIGAVFSYAADGLVEFGDDPNEAGDTRCLSYSPAVPLCGIDGQEPPCENRLCAMRRAIDFGLGDQAAAQALNTLQPLLANALGYMSNTGPGASGTTHYEIIDVFSRTAQNEGICSPQNLIDVVDGMLTYFRPTSSCGQQCTGYALFADLIAMLQDPALQYFLTQFQEQGSSGRAGIQALGGVLFNDLANMPDDSTYFDGLQEIFNTLDQYYQTNPTLYGGLQTDVDDMVPILKAFLDPSRPGAVLVPLTGVAGCMVAEDPNEEVVGALYDLLMQPPSDNASQVTLLGLVQEIDAVELLDGDGLLTDALHAILASTGADPPAQQAIQQFLVQFLTVQNASELLPALATLVNAGVPDEFLNLLDSLMYGCQQPGAAQ